MPFNVKLGKARKKVEFSSLFGEDWKTLLHCLPSKLSSCQPEKFSSIVEKLWKVISFI